MNHTGYPAAAFGYYPVASPGYAGYTTAPGYYPQYPGWNRYSYPASYSQYPNSYYPTSYYPNSYAPQPWPSYSSYPNNYAPQPWHNYSSPYGYGWSGPRWP